MLIKLTVIIVEITQNVQYVEALNLQSTHSNVKELKINDNKKVSGYHE